MKEYKPKALIDGKKLGLVLGKLYVAVPDKFAGRQLKVTYANQSMVIKDWRGEALMFRRFRDKYWTVASKRPQYYTLGYFEFKPEVDNE